ncbi:MAG: Fur family transcriptional regulator [Woeseiaceae bacterium]|nr:Fur family transcriptional regulator [Woeseiaceae bacterium]
MTKSHTLDAGHDHDSCIKSALDRAETICSEQDLRFTALRRRVLELVWEEHKPVGAYDILKRLRDESLTAAPPTVYRALEFLMDAGLVHRLDSLNAFVGCPDPRSDHCGQFLICNECRAVVELDDAEIADMLEAKAEEMGFSVNRQMLEIQGLCESCRIRCRVA